MSQLEIERTLVVSTAHLTKEEIDGLANELGVNDYEYGIDFPISCDEFLNDLKLSKECFALVVLALKNNCQRIKFDSDADEVEGYPIYDW